MDKNSPLQIDSLVALQKLLDDGERIGLSGPGLNAANQILASRYRKPIDHDSATLREKAACVLQVLESLELRCAVSQKITVRLMRVQRRLRTSANLVSLIATSVVVASLAFGEHTVGIVAAIFAFLATLVGFVSEYMIVTRKSDRVSPLAAYEQVSKILTQTRSLRAELQLLLRSDPAPMDVCEVICNANALCAEILAESASLVVDPSGRTSDDAPLAIPLQA